VTHSRSNVQFVKCDTTSWEDQLNLFKSAVAASPAKSVDIVVANAGITGPDEIFELEGNCVPCFPLASFPFPLSTRTREPGVFDLSSVAYRPS
jgi:NAD(P)-dependent dehydrogenase (short-subunit alcohol dehydrogenase family)